MKKTKEAWGIFSFFYSKCRIVERQAPLPITVAGLRSLKNTNKKMNKDFLNFFKPDVTSSSFHKC